MKRYSASSLSGLQSRMRETGGTLTFAEFLADHPPEMAEEPENNLPDDSRLSEMIEEFGRLRVEYEQPVQLDDFLNPVPQLRDLPMALDAAIDMTLRSLSGSGQPDEQSVNLLIQDYPDLEEQIQAASVFGGAILFTRQKGPRQTRLFSDLPMEFGPELETGGRHYRFIEYLGSGVSGEVYLAEDRQLSDSDRPALLAIKVSREAKSGQARKQFVDEATKARRIKHQNVVEVLTRGVTDEGDVYIVYEYVDGGDLLAYGKSDEKERSPRIVAALIVEIARGLQAAHSAGLVHCDLNPKNILLTSGGAPKVTDFGIAIRSGPGRGMTGIGAISSDREGTYAFMAPEQFRMEENARDAAVDIYALGGILSWLLTRELPNGATREEIAATHDAKQGRREAPLLREKHPEIDRDLEGICRRALAPKPEDRYPAPAVLADDLESWLCREPISWLKPSLWHILHLWMVRKPLVASLIIFLIFAIGLGTGVGLHAWEVDGRNQIVRDNLGLMRKNRDALREEGFDSNSFSHIYGSYWVFETTVLGDPPTMAKFWKHRVRIIKERLQLNAKRGLEDSLDSIFWEMALGFWLVGDGEYERSEPLLAGNLEKCRQRLDADDPWIALVEGLRWGAAVNRINDAIKGASSFERDALIAEAGEAAEALAGLLPQIHKISAGGPIGLRLLEKLAILYDGDLLDDAERRKVVQAEMQRLEDIKDGRN